MTNKKDKEFLSFNSDIWINNQEKRKLMIIDLFKNELILERTKKEVVNLLGFEFNDIYSKKWSYFVEEQYFFLFTKKKYLTIYFDENEKVSSINYKPYKTNTQKIASSVSVKKKIIS